MPTGQQYVSTAPQTNLVGNINSSQGTATVVSFTGWPSPPFTGVWDIGTPSQEPVDVTGVSGNAITAMTRGIDGTSGQSHSNNATFTHASIGRDFREARAHIDASASNDSTGHAVHGLTAGSSVVGTTDVQTLTNKTLTSPTVTGLNAANANLTGTVTGAAQYQNIVAGTTAVGSVPLTAKGLAGQTADLMDVTDSVPNILFKVGANGATGAGAVTIQPTDTGNTSLTSRSPNTSTWPFQAFSAGTERFRVDGNGNVQIFTGALAQAGITGATTASRYVGGTAGGPPVSGTFSTGDWVNDTVNGIFWTCTSGGSPGTWTGSGMARISQTTLGSNQASVTFSSIPSYFSQLRLEIMAYAATSGGPYDLLMIFNGDSAAHYEHGQIYLLNSTTPQGGHTGNDSFIHCGFLWANSSTTIPGSTVIDIPNYATTSFEKSLLWSSRASDTGVVSWVEGNGSGGWSSSAAINSLTLSSVTGNLGQNSIFTLYGIP